MKAKNFFKLFFSVILSLILLLPIPASAKSLEYDSSKIIYDVIKSLDFNYSVSDLEESEEIYIESQIEEYLKTTDYYSKISGYKEYDLKMTPSKISDPNNEFSIYYFFKTFISENGEKAFGMYIYDNYTNTVLAVNVAKISSDNSVKDIFSHTNFDAYTTPVPMAGFKWNGSNFACSMAGVVACGVYCGALGVAFLPAGVTCSFVCGAAFAAACASH